MSGVKVAPDEVLLRFAIHTRDADLLVAKRENDRITATVLKLPARYSVPTEDVKVTGLDVDPDYGSGVQRSKTPLAYDFRRTLEVRLTDFDDIEPFIADAVDAGVSSFASLHFRVGNQMEYQFEARQLAVRYAREKAEHLTELTGMKLGKPIRIEEGIEHNWDTGAFGGMAFTQETVREPNAPGTSAGRRVVPVSLSEDGETPARQLVPAPGHIVIEAHVTIEYEMLSE